MMTRLGISQWRISTTFALFLVATFALTSQAQAFEPTMNVSVQTPLTPVFIGTTNLPDGAGLMLTLTGLEVSYVAQSKMVVKNGKFRSERLTYQGAPLVPGRYKLEILMVAAFLNPPNVQAVTGMHGEKMTGRWVVRGVVDQQEFTYTALVNLGESDTTSVSYVDSNDPNNGSHLDVQSSGGKKDKGKREVSNVRQVLDSNSKAAIFTLYARALRHNPNLQGKIVLKLVIDASGDVVDCEVVSSELNNPGLERKLVKRIKSIRFAAQDVETLTITYPIEFSPGG